MHNCQDIEENRCFSNGGTNLHIHAIAQGRQNFFRIRINFIFTHVAVDTNNILQYSIKHKIIVFQRVSYWTICHKSHLS